MTGSAAVTKPALRWFGIVRLGLVQAAIGAVVVLVTSTLNRVMVVEYALPALVPGCLVALHYAVQLIRPRLGFASDAGARRTPWIVGGMALLGTGAVLCSLTSVWIARSPVLGLTLTAAAYALVGLGVGAAGTSLLVLMAKQVDSRRRAAAATLMWILMIAGFAVTSAAVGHFLDPFSPRRLFLATLAVAAIAFAVTLAALWRVERPRGIAGAREHPLDAVPRRGSLSFGAALRRVWADPQARHFTVFVFISMLAYSAQELLLEPFAGLVFGFSLGESAQLSGLWHGAALIGMICVGVACSGTRRFGSLRGWTMGGCIASAVALLSLVAVDLAGPLWPLRVSVIGLGIANGAFAVAAIGSMMELAHAGDGGQAGDGTHAGVRMGLWGAAQAIAFACGGIVGTSIVDSARHVLGSSVAAYAIVFATEAHLFLAAARFVARARPRLQLHLPLTVSAASL